MTGPPERSSPGALAGAAEAKSNLPPAQYTEIPAAWQIPAGPEHVAVAVARVVAGLIRRMEARP
jgi:hypothetical protein